MRRRSLTELAANPDLISGIYNYCDRWCERCSFTSRCLVFATEQEDDDDYPDSRDINNEQFWRRLSSLFKETKEMILEWAAEEGVDLTDLDDDVLVRSKRRRNDAEQHPLALAGKRYADEVRKWFEEFSQTIESSDVDDSAIAEEQSEQVREASEVIYWYQYQIAVKTIRALWSRNNEDDPEDCTDDGSDPKDSDGSAKVALVGVDRSIGAWRLMQMALPERAELIVPLILRLERVRQATEREFPQARDFIRPGFDEIIGEVN
jgi:hypothetical protein